MAKNLPELALSVGVASERGRRDENQDKMSAFSTPLGMVYVVADGMGGYRGGAEASRRVVEGFQRYLNGSGLTETVSLKEQVQSAAQQTNAEIFTESTSGDPSIEGMGSTVVLALLRATPGGMQMMTAHIGDSRAYLLRQSTLYRITRDHSMVQRMVDTGLLTPEQALHHPESNVLSRAIGKQPNVEIEVGELFPLCPGDLVMLCSDGLWGPLTDQQIGDLLTRDTGTQQIADALIQLALDCGSDDNITVQVVRYEYRGLGARSAALFHSENHDDPPSLPPPSVVAEHHLALSSRPKLSSGRNPFRGSDLIFGTLGALVVVGLLFIGYQVLKPMLHRPAVATPEPAPRQSVPSPAQPNSVPALRDAANGLLQPPADTKQPPADTKQPPAKPAQTHPSQHQPSNADPGEKGGGSTPTNPAGQTGRGTKSGQDAVPTVTPHPAVPLKPVTPKPAVPDQTNQQATPPESKQSTAK